MTLTRTPDGSLHITPSGQPGQLIVILHGVGSSAAAMQPLAEALASGQPTAAIVAINGYDPFDLGGAGRQWFSVKGVTDANRPERIAEAMPRIEALLSSEEQRVGVTRQQTVLVGFSQGAIMGLHLAASSAEPPRAVIGLSGRVALPLRAGEGPRPPVLLSHGVADPVIPVSELDVAAAALTEAGCHVETQTIPGLGHTVDPRQIDRILDFIRTIP